MDDYPKKVLTLQEVELKGVEDLTVEDVHTYLVEEVLKHPDAQRACMYLENHQPHCLVGVYLHDRHGVEIHALQEFDLCNGQFTIIKGSKFASKVEDTLLSSTFYSLAKHYGFDKVLDEKVINYLNAVQELQDSGKVWGEVIATVAYDWGLGRITEGPLKAYYDLVWYEND